MSKTLVANPVWGLKGIPARIIMETKALTVKTGVFGGKSIPYSNISSVNFTGANSLTLAGTIEIIPFRGSVIKADGFYKSQYKQVKQAVENGYFDDSVPEPEADSVPEPEQKEMPVPPPPPVTPTISGGDLISEINVIIAKLEYLKSLVANRQ